MKLTSFCGALAGLWLGLFVSAQSSQPSTQPVLPPGAILRLGDAHFAVDQEMSLGRVGFSPNGRHLVTATRLGIDVWYVEGGAHFSRMIEEHLPDQAFFVGENRIAALLWAGENRLHVYDAETGQMLRRVNIPRQGQIHAFTAGEGRVAILANSIQVYDTNTGRLICQLPAQRDGKFIAHENAIRLSADGKVLAARLTNDRIRFFNTDLKRPCGEVEHKDADSEYFWLSGDGGLISLLDNHQQASIYTRGGNLVRTMVPNPPPNPPKGYCPYVGKAVLSQDGKRVAMSVNQSVEIYPLAGEARQPVVIPFRFSGPKFIEFSPDAGKLVALFDSGRPMLYRTDTGQECDPAEGHRTMVYDALPTPDGKELIVAARGGGLFRWSLETGQLLARNDERQGFHSQLAWMPDEGLLLDIVDTGFATVVDAKTMRPVRWPELKFPANGAMRRTAVSDDAAVIVSPMDGTAVRVVDVRTGKVISRIEFPRGPIDDLAISPNKRVVAVTQAGQTTLYDVSTSDPLLALPRSNLGNGSARFSRDGRFLLIGSHNQIVLWDLGDAKPAAPIWRVSLQSAYAPRFSPSQRLIVSPTESDVVVCETVTGAELARLGSHFGRVTVARFASPDRIVSTGTDSIVYFWSLREAIRQIPLSPDATLQELWRVTCSPNTPQAWRAGLELLERGELARFAADLPVEPSSPQAEEIRELLGQLRSDDSARRETAHRKLESLAPRAVMLVEEAMQSVPQSEYLDRLHSLAEIGRRGVAGRTPRQKLAVQLRVHELLSWASAEAPAPSSLFLPTTQPSPDMLWLTHRPTTQPSAERP